MGNSNLAKNYKAANRATQNQSFKDVYPEYVASPGSPQTLKNGGRPKFIDAPDELLAKLYVSQGTEWAFNELVNRHSCNIYKLAYRYTGDESVANDVLQEVFLTLFQKLDSFRGESKFSTWLYTIAKNTSFMYLRTNKKHQSNISLTTEYKNEEGDLTELQIEDWRFIPDTVMIEDEKRYKIDEAISGIPEIYSKVLRMRDIEGYTNIEIGEMLNISLPAVKSRIRRARIMFKEKLAVYGQKELQ